MKPADIAHFAMPCVLPRVAAGIAKKAGMPDAAVRDNLHTVCGETGAAHPLVMLVDALEQAKPGEKILVVGFGQGCDALLFEATENLAKLAPRLGVKGHLARRKEETNYAKFLAFNDLVAIERGMRAEVDKADAAVLALPQPAHADGLHRRPVQEVRHAAVPQVQGVREPQLQRLPHAGRPPLRRHAGQGAVLHRRPPHLLARPAALLRHGGVRGGRAR